ncbi:ABC-F family ATP-binding cassette domain-containing protein [Mariluticola halotolerans]|uniref:ABC-F family ATP-binding cassette domain-containing protein n=1 Tax=Mariluticola halotolerans TaxID=2909283 RepID=UPI0026E31EC0|nr:ABC-F family ATP-binding cassette domain-containing protein [Mariluticola halotolerans]UJQ93232.1 ABC-F family ATP-binding cassette domain-containing protein [Mariluticola halotolerans]
MAAPLLALQNINLTFGGDPLLEGTDLSVAMGEKIALVGRNGSGKSTLLKIAAGEVEADSGERFIQPGATIRYLPQEPDLSGFATTLDYVEAGLTGGDNAYRAQYLLDHLGLNGTEDPSQLSGGEARRAALARVLAPEPDILLLDEPTNHLDLPAIEWLQSELASLRSALVIISHDRRFLSDLTRQTLWLDRGRSRRLNQGFAGFEAWRDKALEEEEQERHKLDRQIVREEHWVRYGVTARRKRNVRRMSELAGLREQRVNQRAQTGNVQLAVAEGKTSGAIIVDAENISKSYDGRPIVTDLTLRIMRGDRLGIVGPNGAGKTTLIKLLTGTLQPDSGTIKLGTNLEVATLDQQRSSLKPQTTLKDALTGGGADTILINGQSRHVISYMRDFLFAPEQAGTAVSKLSGGERARVTLARALALPSNVLVLDEPTNDLDLETLDLLQEMIADYPGTVIVVSHDRDFLDRVATSILAFEGDGHWGEYAGGYADMLAQRGADVAARAAASEARKPKAGLAPTAPPPPKKKKLSFNQQHALKTLPGRIKDLTASIAATSEKLAAPDFYAKDPEGFAKLTKQLDKLQTELSACEDEWLELELLREETGA